MKCANILLLKLASISIFSSYICLNAYANQVYQQSKYPITELQKQIAKNIAENGIPIQYIRKNAPSHYIVKSGDTLWEISGKFLTKPTLWPALWGVNKNKIINPHLIYPGQHLYLIKKN